MNLSIIIFIILIIIIFMLYYKLNNINKIINNLININHNLLKENSNIKELTLDNLKVKNLEIENNLISPNIKTNNLSSNNNLININSDIYVNNDINVNPKAGIKVKLDLGNGTDKPYLGNKDKSFELKNTNTNYKLSFNDMIIRDLTYLYHVENNKLHNGKSSDQFVNYMMNKNEKEENIIKNKIENFTDLFYL